MSERITLTQLVEITGSDRTLLVELIDIGWVTPSSAAGDYVFAERDVYRLRKVLRLMQDFELTPVGGSIIVDLLERIEELEREVAGLRKLL